MAAGRRCAVRAAWRGGCWPTWWRACGADVATGPREALVLLGLAQGGNLGQAEAGPHPRGARVWLSSVCHANIL